MKNRIFLVLTIILVIGLLATLTAMTTTKAQTSGNSITLYAGSVNSGSGTYGYGLSSSKITSPGPTLTLVEGTTYTITVDDVSTMQHSFEIVSTKAIGTPLWNSGIDITSFIPAGGSGSATVTPTQTGNFFYVCTVPAHISLGMWGNVVVSAASTSPTPTIPEFPSALTLMFVALAVTAMAAFAARQKIKPNNYIKSQS